MHAPLVTFLHDSKVNVLTMRGILRKTYMEKKGCSRNASPPSTQYYQNTRCKSQRGILFTSPVLLHYTPPCLALPLLPSNLPVLHPSYHTSLLASLSSPLHSLNTVSFNLSKSQCSLLYGSAKPQGNFLPIISGSYKSGLMMLRGR